MEGRGPEDKTTTVAGVDPGVVVVGPDGDVEGVSVATHPRGHGVGPRHALDLR